MVERELIGLRNQCIDSLLSCVEHVAMFLNGEEKQKEFSNLRSCVQEYCMLEARQSVADQALEIARAETNTTNVESLQERFKSYLSNLTGGQHDLNNHPYMMELNKRIQNVSQDLDESDLAITQTQECFIDPNTMKPIQDPVKNMLCGHIYERETIMELINKREKVICPVAGCGNRTPLVTHQLSSSGELRQRVALKQQQQRALLLSDRSIIDLDTNL